ncbi:hypothetical protein [Moraxella sp. ZY200743]|uniref:hypothetical protein n=1 Tax=Moraxella sp. ZY200743 TaxID=2911970 RepID=UPI003D7E74E6
MSDESDLALLQQSDAGNADNTLCLMQINHAGKQVSKDVNPKPVAPSAVALEGMADRMNSPRALTLDEIETILISLPPPPKLPKKQVLKGCKFMPLTAILSASFYLHIITDERMSMAVA